MLARLASHGRPADCRWRSNAPSGLVVDRLLAAGHPVVPGRPWRLPRRPAPLGRRRRQVRPRRQLQARRLPAHRRPPAAPAASRWTRPPASCRRWSGCATTTSRPRPPPATSSARCWTPTGPAPSGLLPAGLQDRPGLPAELPDPAGRRPARPGQLAAFCRRHAYRGGRRPAELLERLRSAPTPPVGLDPTVLAQLVGAQVQLLRHPAGHHRRPRPGHQQPAGHAPQGPPAGPTAPRRPASASPSSSPSSAPSWTAPAAPSTPPPRPAPPRSPARRARPAASTSAWPPTAAPAKPCTSSPTTPATAPHGRPSSTPTPAPAASATPKPSASSAAPGCGSSGPAGTPTPPTTRPKHRAEQRLAA